MHDVAVERARSAWPSIMPSRSARILTNSLVPPGARLRRRISSCRRGSEAKCNRPAVAVARLRAPSLDRLGDLSRSGPKSRARASKKERRPSASRS